MKKILVFGNPYLKEDNLAVRVAKKLNIKGLKVIFCASPDELLEHQLDDCVILDVAKGLKKVVMFDDIDKLEFSNIFSLHDFDLGFFLKLLKATGKLKKVKIIGVPPGPDEEKTLLEIKSMLNKKDKKNSIKMS